MHRLRSLFIALAVVAGLFVVSPFGPGRHAASAATCTRYDHVNSGNLPDYSNPAGDPVYTDLVAYYCSDYTEYFVLAVGVSGRTPGLYYSDLHLRVWVCGSLVEDSSQWQSGGTEEYRVSPVYQTYGCGIQADNATSWTIAADSPNPYVSHPYQPGGYSPYVSY